MEINGKRKFGTQKQENLNILEYSIQEERSNDLK